MLSYDIAGSVLTIRGALLLIDVSELAVPLDKEAATERLRRLFEGLRPKVGRVCAVIVEIDRVAESRFFQIAG